MTELYEFLWNLAGEYPWIMTVVTVLIGLHPVASAITKFTDTPADDRIYGKFYKWVIEPLAMATGKAKMMPRKKEKIKDRELFSRPLATVAALGLALLVLGGCAAFGTTAVVDDENAQTSAGITDVQVNFCENAEGGQSLCGIHWRDGKEKANVSMALDVPGLGTMEYSASDVGAFPGQDIRGAVEQALVQAGVDQTEALQELVPRVVEALKPLWAQ